jgi:class 3 adenylate cyclase
MKCPECQFENREKARFCKECGTRLELACQICGAVYESGSKFCDECGHSLVQESQNEKAEFASEGERKHVTVLFSDLSGYTAMSEKLDPEEVKEITGRILDDVSKIVSKYGGFIEKYAGDAVMALFGVNQSHEDDPVRAVKSAEEIHELVKTLSPQYEEKIGQPLSMHSGINTGLVVTGELNLEKGVHGVAGDAVNVASRLSSMAELNPLSSEASWFLGEALYYAGRHDEAIAQNLKTLDLNPYYWPATVNLARVYLQKGQYAEAIALLNKTIESGVSNPQPTGILGYAFARAGQKREAEKILEEFKQQSQDRYISPIYFTLIHIGLSNINQAFDWMDKSLEEHSWYIPYLKVFPEFDPLRNDPRFEELLKKVRLLD